MENDNRVRLRVLGISYTRLKNSAYMLILSQVNGPRHIHMWIGESEAQAIALAMERVKTPRPLTHDLFVSFTHAFGVRLKEVFIYKADDEIYSSELTFTDGDRTVTLDSRTSDAVALAMRTGASIFTTREIIEEKGFLLDISKIPDDDTDEIQEDDEGGPDIEIEPLYDDDDIDEADTPHGNLTPKYENMTVEELERTLQKLIDREEYEAAAQVNVILQHKKGMMP